jgi:hypothetical protein
MRRFITIDSHSGYIWGDIEALDALAAGEKTDRQADSYRGYYDWADDREHANYLVYEPPSGFPPVVDGRNADTIAAVERDCAYCGAITLHKHDQ